MEVIKVMKKEENEINEKEKKEKHEHEEDEEEMSIYKLASLMGFLDNRVRLTILLILRENKEGLYFSELYEKLLERGIAVKPTTLAYHLEILGNAKFIKNRYVRNKRGYSLYRISKNGEKALEILEKVSKNTKTKH